MIARPMAVLALVLAGCSASVPAATTPVSSDAMTAATATPDVSVAMPSPTASPRGGSQGTANGAWLIFQGDGLMIATLGGGDVTRLFTGAEPAEPAHADFSPDGRQIAFQAGHEGSWDIWIANADGSRARDLVDCTSPCTILNDPAWSPLGNEIAFSKLSEIGDDLPSALQIVDVRTGTVRTVLTEPSGLAIEQPRWSRDARSIVLSLQDHRSPDGGLIEHPLTSTVGIVDLDDAKPSYRPLTDPNLNASYPDWNPDDDRILFQAGDRIWWNDITTSRSQIWTIQADGSDLRQISAFQPDGPVYWMPAWSAAGNRILATRTDRATRDNAIVYVPLDGSMPSTVLVAGAHARQSRARGG